MAILTKAHWIKNLLNDQAAQQYQNEDLLFNDRSFDWWSEPTMKAKMKAWVASGAIPPARTINERVEDTGEGIIMYREWNDRAAAQEFVDHLTTTAPVALVSVEIVDV